MSNLIDIEKLTVRQRLDLISELWDSISDDEFEDDLTPEQKAEMDRIYEQAMQHPELCRTLEETMQQLRAG